MPDDFDFSKRPQRAGTQPMPPLTTFLLMGICLVATLPVIRPGLLDDPLWQQVRGAFDIPNESIWSGKYQGLITNVFEHGNILHILFNMMWLYPMGMALEATIGPLLMLVIMAAAGFVASGAELAFTGQTGIGFSGIVYALFGMMWAGKGRYPAWDAIATRDNWRYMIGWGVFCIVTTVFNWWPVANFAHFGGLLFGLSIGYAFFAPRRRPLWIIAAVLLIIVAVLSATWMPWSPEWRDWHMAQTVQ
jgi:GlpG protein